MCMKEATESDVLEATPLENELLVHLPYVEWELLRPHSKIVTLKNAEKILNEHDPSDVTYFPLTCIISMIAEMERG